MVVCYWIMEEEPSTHLRRLHSRLGSIAFELTRVQFSHLCPPTSWAPAINGYRCDDMLVICAELAGVDKDLIDLTVKERSLRLRGRREAPEPAAPDFKAQQVLCIEIDYGCFERFIELPAEVDTTRIKAEQRNGLLWIYLPLRAEG